MKHSINALAEPSQETCRHGHITNVKIYIDVSFIQAAMSEVVHLNHLPGIS